MLRLISVTLFGSLINFQKLVDSPGFSKPHSSEPVARIAPALMMDDLSILALSLPSARNESGLLRNSVSVPGFVGTSLDKAQLSANKLIGRVPVLYGSMRSLTSVEMVPPAFSIAEVISSFGPFSFGARCSFQANVWIAQRNGSSNTMGCMEFDEGRLKGMWDLWILVQDWACDVFSQSEPD